MRMDEIKDYLKEEWYVLVLSLIGLVGAVALWVLVIGNEITNKKTVTALKDNGYTEITANNFAGTYVYRFKKNGKTYVVGEGVISEYIN